MQVGSAMIRGISGGQKKRVTTAEMVCGPKKVRCGCCHAAMHDAPCPVCPFLGCAHMTGEAAGM